MRVLHMIPDIGISNGDDSVLENMVDIYKSLELI